MHPVAVTLFGIHEVGWDSQSILAVAIGAEVVIVTHGADHFIGFGNRTMRFRKVAAMRKLG